MSEKKPIQHPKEVTLPDMSRRGFLKGLTGVVAQTTGLAPKVPLASLDTLPAAEAAAAVAISPARLLSFITYPNMFDGTNHLENLNTLSIREVLEHLFYFYKLTSDIPENTDLFNVTVEKGGIHGVSDIPTVLFSKLSSKDYGFLESQSRANDGNTDLIFKNNNISSVKEVMQKIFPGRTKITPLEIRSLFKDVFEAKLDKPMSEILQEIHLAWDTNNEESVTENLKSIERVCEDLQLPEYAAKIKAEVDRREAVKKNGYEEMVKRDNENTKKNAIKFLKDSVQGGLEGEYNVFYFTYPSNLDGFKHVLNYVFENLFTVVDNSKIIIEPVSDRSNSYKVTILDPEVLQKILDVRNKS